MAKLSGQHAAKFFLSTELKARVMEIADALDRPFADTCRHLMWMGLPIVEAMLEAHNRGSRFWLAAAMGRSRRAPADEQDDAQDSPARRSRSAKSVV